ncbi:hypothetical protein [Flavobacterium sp.]|uniref:hypothetical protein n=1 Tax=Flavobacterium sp. TaxID=239 RepID=UPI00260FEBD1|nr:hypothetical protein [Flavobacterium sp.]
MKTKFFALLLLGCWMNGFGQTMETLKSQTQKMYKASVELNMETIMDLTYPKVFDIVDRETLTKAMAGVFDNETMKVTFTNLNPAFTYSDIKEVDGKKFNVIRYNNAMKMTLKGEHDEATIAQMKDGLEGSGKFKKIDYDAASKSFLLEGPAVMIAVADDTTKKEWTFVNYDDEQLFSMIFDEKIKTALGL